MKESFALMAFATPFVLGPGRSYLHAPRVDRLQLCFAPTTREWWLWRTRLKPAGAIHRAAEPVPSHRVSCPVLSCLSCPVLSIPSHPATEYGRLHAAILAFSSYLRAPLIPGHLPCSRAARHQHHRGKLYAGGKGEPFWASRKERHPGAARSPSRLWYLRPRGGGDRKLVPLRTGTQACALAPNSELKAPRFQILELSFLAGANNV